MHANYAELNRRIIMTLSDHVKPGNRVRTITMLMPDIHFFRCKMVVGSGKVEKPMGALVRLEHICTIPKGQYICLTVTSRIFYGIFSQSP